MQTDIIPVSDLLRKKPDCLIYHFCGKPITESEVQIEAQILSSIERNGTGLSLFRTEGIVKGEFFTQRRSTVYQLRQGHTRADFAFLKHNEQTVADIIMLYRNPISQGDYFSLKDFVLRKLCLTLFDVGISMILGTASPNSMVVKKKRTEEALVKLYQHLGFSRVPGSNEVFMTKQVFTEALTGRKVHSSFQRPSNLSDASRSLLR
ncbi:MAG TPA: hypothetical protein PLC99_14685 [Verrucomicrobiota bacterium]|nr:hypothetical protein [Verrucomicrobiota bacterium]